MYVYVSKYVWARSLHMLLKNFLCIYCCVVLTFIQLYDIQCIVLYYFINIRKQQDAVYITCTV